nr:hypothetical protein Hi04_10k_c4921_00032 [uncultured bacterium]
MLRAGLAQINVLVKPDALGLRAFDLLIERKLIRGVFTG